MYQRTTQGFYWSQQLLLEYLPLNEQDAVRSRGQGSFEFNRNRTEQGVGQFTSTEVH